jgi:Tfp pilus assembly protein PilZ
MEIENMGKERRQATRHTCKQEVGYAIQDLSYIDYIHDINAWGVFIQSKQPLPVGESILMTIPLLCDETSIKVVGEVVWSGPEGMGVRFDMGIGVTAMNTILGDHER